MAPPIKCHCGTCRRCKHRIYMQAYYWRNREKTCETARQSRQRRIEAVRQFDRDRGYRVYDKREVAARLAVTHAVEDGSVNPDHLEAITGADHRRTHNAFEPTWTARAARTHCKNGHAFTPENTGRRTDNGGRICRACKRDEFHRRKARRVA